MSKRKYSANLHGQPVTFTIVFPDVPRFFYREDLEEVYGQGCLGASSLPRRWPEVPPEHRPLSYGALQAPERRHR